MNNVFMPKSIWLFLNTEINLTSDGIVWSLWVETHVQEVVGSILSTSYCMEFLIIFFKNVFFVWIDRKWTKEDGMAHF